MMQQQLPKQAILIVNAASRVGADQFESARDGLVAAGLDLVDAKAITSPSELETEIGKAVERAPMVIVGGGDGTLSLAVDHFRGKDTVFGILPLGTANSFARALGVPLDLESAIRIVADGRRKRIDLGAIDDDYFANTASIGLSPMIAETVPPKLKKILGRFAYLVWGIRCAMQFQPFRLKIFDGERTHSLWSTEVRIANGGHFGGVELVETAKLDSGEILIEAVTGRSLLVLAWTWIAAVMRIRKAKENITEFRGKEFRVRTWPRLWVAIDGELSKRTPVVVRVAGCAIDVAAPREVQPSRDSAAESRSASAARSE